MDFQAQQWYNGGFRGRAPPIEYGTIVKGETFRVKDLWCSIWYTRFVGTKAECEEWIRKEHERDYPIMVVKYEVEGWKG